jgi:putative SOS response-associated peptidase YedK
MCGRFSIFTDKSLIEERFHATADFAFRPRYNVAPGQESIIIMQESPQKLTMARWGLVPHWANDPGISYKMINARAETILLKPTYRRPFMSQRCLVISDGFYEWKLTEQGKIPYRIELEGRKLFAYAGLYERWQDLLTFTIVTTEPNEQMIGIHNRMPLILNGEDEELWIASPSEEILLRAPNVPLHIYRISDRVNNPVNDTPDILNLKEEERSGSSQRTLL